MEKIYLFTDYRGQFSSSTKHRGAAVNLKSLKQRFADQGFELIIKPFVDVNLRSQNYKDSWVLYQSSEDPGLFYKDYIEDILLGLQLQGAKLIPSFKYFRAHHNKNFMEILRDMHGLEEIKNLQAWSYGTYEDFEKNAEKFDRSSFVLKAAATSKGQGVSLLERKSDKMKIPKKISKTFSFKNLQYLFETIKTGKKHLPISNHRRKFIVQEFVQDLKGDYRVIVYGDKYYALYRENRKNDFRASGSMKFHQEFSIPDGLLDYASKVSKSFNTPYMSLDIGFKKNTFFLFEFQFVSFGQYTLEKSTHHFRNLNGVWEKIVETPDLEREIANSVTGFISKNR